MMYWARFAIVCASVFILLYAALSLVLACVWNRLKNKNLIQSADGLFALRVSPAVTAFIVLALIVVPSFWVLEPPATDEWIGFWAALLTFACLAWLASRSVNLYRAWRHTASIFRNASLWDSADSSLPIYEVRGAGANLFIAGILKPRLLVSRRTMELLDAEELQAAIRHELAHAGAADNLKQIVVRFCGFPLLGPLDRAWLRAAEIAADDRSVGDALAAADLASALIKVGKESAALTPELGMSLVPETDTPVKDRVQRLLDWKSKQHTNAWRFALSLLLAQTAMVALNVTWLLPQMHRFTELLFQ